jgi:predicted phage tail protein
MKKVFLHGELGESLGKEWDLEVDSVQEVFCAIEANTSRFTRFLAENSEKFKYYTFRIDDEYLTSKKELESKLPKKAKNIHIMPQIAGGNPVQILIQVVVAVATSLIMQALFKPPKAKEQKETKSYLFAGTQNVAAQGIPVPLGYGRLKVGSVVVSAAIRHLPYVKGPNNYGGGMGIHSVDYWSPQMAAIIREGLRGNYIAEVGSAGLIGPSRWFGDGEIIGNNWAGNFSAGDLGGPIPTVKVPGSDDGKDPGDN